MRRWQKQVEHLHYSLAGHRTTPRRHWGRKHQGGCLSTIRIEPSALPLAASLSRHSVLALRAIHPSAVAGADLREDTVETGASDRKRRRGVKAVSSLIKLTGEDEHRDSTELSAALCLLVLIPEQQKCFSQCTRMEPTLFIKKHCHLPSCVQHCSCKPSKKSLCRVVSALIMNGFQYETLLFDCLF